MKKEKQVTPGTLARRKAINMRMLAIEAELEQMPAGNLAITLRKEYSELTAELETHYDDIAI